jgi:type I restriction enzyme S subunit
MSARWPKVRLGELLRRSEESIALQPDALYRELTVKLWGKGVALRGIVTGADIAAERRYVARTGQFILSRIDARNGALGFVPSELDGAIVSNDFPVFTLDTQRLFPTFLEWMSRTEAFVERCRKASEGTTNRVRLQEAKFLSLEIPLPPLPEQLRAVARIEELAAQIQEARALHRLVEQEAEALRASSLRSMLIHCQAEEIELEAACESIIDNLHSNPRYTDSGVPCVRSPDVGWGTLHLDTALRTAEEEYRRRTVRGEPQADDIVFVREGGGTGKCALVLPGQRFSLGQRVMMLRANKQLVLPRFFLYQLLSPLVQGDQIGPLCKGSASPHLNIGALRRFNLRLPSLPVQRRIVAELDALQAELDALKRFQAQTATELDAILPAILDRVLPDGL